MYTYLYTWTHLEARGSLLGGLHPVCALSILHRLTSKAEEALNDHQ